MFDSFQKLVLYLIRTRISMFIDPILKSIQRSLLICSNNKNGVNVIDDGENRIVRMTSSE